MYWIIRTSFRTPVSIKDKNLAITRTTLNKRDNWYEEIFLYKYFFKEKNWKKWLENTLGVYYRNKHIVTLFRDWNSKTKLFVEWWIVMEWNVYGINCSMWYHSIATICSILTFILKKKKNESSNCSTIVFKVWKNR